MKRECSDLNKRLGLIEVSVALFDSDEWCWIERAMARYGIYSFRHSKHVHFERNVVTIKAMSKRFAKLNMDGEVIPTYRIWFTGKGVKMRAAGVS